MAAAASVISVAERRRLTRRWSRIAAHPAGLRAIAGKRRQVNARSLAAIGLIILLAGDFCRMV